MAVLIETLWNVNPSVPFRNLAISSVLIETLWNVNLFGSVQKSQCKTY